MASKLDACKTENWIEICHSFKGILYFCVTSWPWDSPKDPIQCWGGHAEKCPSTVVRCKFTRVNVISTMVEPHYLHTNVWTGDGARESQELMDQLADDMDELMRLMQEGTGVNPCEGVIQINGYWLHQCPDLKTMVPSNPWPKDRKFLVFLSVHIADRNISFSLKPFFGWAQSLVDTSTTGINRQTSLESVTSTHWTTA